MGSGGFEIGQKVAERLGLKFYDKELLVEAARESGISTECFNRVDEQVSSVYSGVGIFGMRFPFITDPAFSDPSTLSADNLFLTQSRVMCDIASRENALFVGRCADYVLRDHHDLLSVFLSADTTDRTARIAARRNCTADQARQIIRKSDKQRSAYYDYFSNKVWGAASSYDLCVNTSTVKVDVVIDMICAAAKSI